MVKKAPGERKSWLTTTRSAPLVMKVPLAVIRGSVPKKRSSSFISPVALTSSLALT
jgi:hypothetical protein